MSILLFFGNLLAQGINSAKSRNFNFFALQQAKNPYLD